jgi:glutathione gamma-glutamylcysteinyltransferase
MTETLYRRPLPPAAIAFSSPEGRHLFAEALAAGGLGGYFPLAEQFHTQADPAFCGLGSLVVALNALAIDPGRLWKGPWRWFSEELLDCCVPLEEVRRRGLALDELACLARCNAAEVDLYRADSENLDSWRAALTSAAHGGSVIIASYDRAAIGQTGAGHFSPIGGFHAQRDLALVLDVARFKYPPHWISAEGLWKAMQVNDPMTGRARGWLVIRCRTKGVALAFSLSCEGEGWQALAARISVAINHLGPTADIAELARAIAPLTAHLTVRNAGPLGHLAALAEAGDALSRLSFYGVVADNSGPERAKAVAILSLAIADLLPAPWRAALDPLVKQAEDNDTLRSELANLRAQLAAVATLGAGDDRRAISAR